MTPSGPKKQGLLGCAAAVACLVSTQPARADESEAARLFREGRALMHDRRFDEACPELEESQRLEPHVGTLLNVAACHEEQGKVAEAWAEYEQALTAAHVDGDVERERFARERVAALAGRVPWLTVVPPAGGGSVRIELDGAPLSPAALGQPMPVDPGSHVVTAIAEGRAPFEARIDLDEGERRSILVPIPVGAPATTVAEAPGPRAPATAPGDHRGWVVEAGLLVGLWIAQPSRMAPADPTAIPVYDASRHTVVSNCELSTCTYYDGGADQSILGIEAFVGRSLSADLALGGRLLAGPASGGSAVVLGPSVSVHLGGRFWGGASAFVGYSTSAVDTYVSGATSGSGPVTVDTSTKVTLRGDIGVALGAGLDLEWRFVVLRRGSIALDTMPLVLLGTAGTAWSLPFGVAYRFE